MAGTAVLPCKCKHNFQDETYGKGMRLHNVSGNKDEAFCTVCCISIDPTTGRPRLSNLGKYIKNSKPFKKR